MVQIINDNVFNYIKEIQNNNFNLIFSDPPYNLGSKWQIDDSGKLYVKNKKDFMDKWNGLDENDLDLFFKESYRILKYGGFLLMFGMDRQLLPFQYFATKNGFEQQQSLYWFTMSGFPKASDVSKMINKRVGTERNDVEKGITESPSSDMAKIFNGYKYSISPLKQVLETLLVFRKPTKNNSILDDVMESLSDNEISPSILNIEKNRVNYVDEKDKESARFGVQTDIRGNAFNTNKPSKGDVYDKNVLSSEIGRYPSQLYVDDVSADNLDKQSGIRQFSNKKGGYSYKGNEYQVDGFVKNNKPEALSNYGDGGGSSKILHKCNYENGDMDIVNFSSKVSQKERNEYCGGEELNNHPTLKPISLITKLANLFKLPEELNQKVFIPFSGAGSEIIGFIKAGYNPDNIVGCELNTEFYKISMERIEYYQKNHQNSQKSDKKCENDVKNNENSDILNLFFS